VSLKVFPATVEDNVVAPAGQLSRPLFAHLKLRADAVDDQALDWSPTMRAMGCSVDTRTPNQVTAMNLMSTPRTVNYC
jgi:hypothetical protein